ncbi:MAG: ribosome biogenesis GTPase Der [bacterium]|nr:ribosome biogenesis GTPase Der [bacterium]
METEKRNPIVAILGRPNVGKSTLFNRIIGQRKSIVDSFSGLTRDRIYGTGTWGGKNFEVIDTGGLDFEGLDNISAQVRAQVDIAIVQADFIIFMVDAKTGVLPVDKEIIDKIRRTDKKYIVVVNKVDTEAKTNDIYDFYQFGTDELLPISASHGLNINTLLDKVTEDFSDGENASSSDEIRIAIVGGPNVGKSSYVNAILGDKRLIVDEEPGTTRDAVDSFLKYKNASFVLVDTAGIRARNKLKTDVERYSVIRAQKAIQLSDIAILIIDITKGPTREDKKIASFVCEQGKGLIIAINKADLSKKLGIDKGIWLEQFKANLKFLNFASVVFISALKKEKIFTVMDMALNVHKYYTERISTAVLNKMLEDAKKRRPFSSTSSKQLKIKYITQVSTCPPTFALFVNNRNLIMEDYLNYLKNNLYNDFGFEGVPIRFKIKETT